MKAYQIALLVLNVARVVLIGFYVVMAALILAGCAAQKARVVVIEDGAVYQIERPVEDRWMKIGWKGWV